MPFGNGNIYFKDFFSSVLSQFKGYHPSGNLKIYNLVIFQSSKILRILVENIPPISRKLNPIPPRHEGWKQKKIF